MAKAGHTQLVAPLMNLSKVTRNCIHLQPIMMNVKLGRRGMTQLHHSAINGLTTSVKRFLSIRNINVNMKDDMFGATPLHAAAANGHVEISRLLKYYFYRRGLLPLFILMHQLSYVLFVLHSLILPYQLAQLVIIIIRVALYHHYSYHIKSIDTTLQNQNIHIFFFTQT
jgi:hypothetical protein